jgi:hypothetical protein
MLFEQLAMGVAVVLPNFGFEQLGYWLWRRQGWLPRFPALEAPIRR